MYSSITQVGTIKAGKDSSDAPTYATTNETSLNYTCDSGIAAKFDIKPKAISTFLDFGARTCSSGSYTPYLKFDLSRVANSITPSIGLFGLFNNFKYNVRLVIIAKGVLNLVNASLPLTERFEYIHSCEKIRLHGTLLSVWNLTNWKKPDTLNFKLSGAVKKVEASVILGLDGTKSECPVHFDVKKLALALSREDGENQFAGEILFDTANLNKSGNHQVTFGYSRKWASNFTSKAKYNVQTKTLTGYNMIESSKEVSVATTFQVQASQDGAKGFLDYPFNFGLQVNLNA